MSAALVKQKTASQSYTTQHYTISLAHIILNAKVIGNESGFLPDLMKRVILSRLRFTVVPICEHFVLLLSHYFIQSSEEMNTIDRIVIVYSGEMICEFLARVVERGDFAPTIVTANLTIY